MSKSYLNRLSLFCLLLIGLCTPCLAIDQGQPRTVELYPRFVVSVETNELELHIRDLDDQAVIRLGQRLLNLPNLQHLEFTLNGINDHQIVLLAPYLGQLVNLRSLDLTAVGLGDEGLQALAPQLDRLVNLRSLDLRENNISDQGLRALAGHVDHLVTLTGCELGFNNITVEGIRELAPHLTRRLESLDLDGIDLGTGMRALVPSLVRFVELDWLALSGIELDEADIHELGNCLGQLVNLQYLRLSNDNLNNERIILLAPYLDRLVNLRLLELESNDDIDQAGIEALAQHSAHLPHFEIEGLGGPGDGLGRYKAADLRQLREQMAQRDLLEPATKKMQKKL